MKSQEQLKKDEETKDTICLHAPSWWLISNKYYYSWRTDQAKAKLRLK